MASQLKLTNGQIVTIEPAAQTSGAATLSIPDLAGVAKNISALTTAEVAVLATLLGASANGKSLVTAADYSAMRTLLGLVIGTNVQAYDADLAAVAAAGTGAELAKMGVHGADIASASTTNLETATGELVDVTGTTTITAITLSDGHRRIVRFTGILTLTHGASLVLPGAANIVTAAGDVAVFEGYASSVVRCVGFMRAAVAPFNPAAPGPIGATTPATGAFTTVTGQKIVPGGLLQTIDGNTTWNGAAFVIEYGGTADLDIAAGVTPFSFFGLALSGITIKNGATTLCTIPAGECFMYFNDGSSQGAAHFTATIVP